MQMSLTMAPLIASILIFDSGADTRFWLILISLAAGTILLVAICTDIVRARINRSRSRNWAEVSAVVDIVSVAYIEGNSMAFNASSYDPYYRATPTYIYRSPEKQMGDYSRDFGKKEDAEAWANSYKGGTVKIHVDPRDPTRSVLREEDL
jgi:hypothetical protein